MNKSFLVFFFGLLISLSSVKGQDTIFSCMINFENDPCLDGSYLNLYLPGVNSIWSIGTPHNTVFDSAFSWSNAIFTDGGYYPDNNTSSFFISVARSPFCFCQAVIGGWYKFDSDSLKDFGKIEFSTDNGSTWLNALSDTVIPDENWMTPKPVLTGRIHQWREFDANLPYNYQSDTLTYRFTFISDSVETNQEGWMLDNIKLLVHTEGMEDLGSREGINIYPNPAYNAITVSVKTLTGQMNILIYDIVGQLRLQKTIFRNDENIDISGLGKVVYMVKVSDGRRSWVRKVVKE